MIWPTRNYLRNKPAKKRAARAAFRSAAGLLLCVLVCACREEAPSDSYFPLQKGLAWEYRMVKETPLDRSEKILRIANIGEREAEGARYRVRQTSSGNHYYIAERADGIVRVAKRAIIEEKPDFSQAPRYVIKNPIRPGTRWSHAAQAFLLSFYAGGTATELKESVFYTMHWKIIATDAMVLSQAGRFDNCLHIRGSGTTDIPRPLSPRRDAARFRTDEWYAPGVGLVKLAHEEIADSDQTYGGTITLDLIAFSI